MRRIALKMKAYSWAASEFTGCPRVPMRKTGFGLQLDSGDYVLGWEGDGKCLKCFGGPGRVRTVDLFHAMEVKAYRLQTIGLKPKDLCDHRRARNGHGTLDLGTNWARISGE